MLSSSLCLGIEEICINRQSKETSQIVNYYGQGYGVLTKQ